MAGLSPDKRLAEKETDIIMRQIADHVYIFPFFASFLNLYLAETPQGLLLIDTGVSAAQINGVAAELRKMGRTITDIQHIFITHAHSDHIGGLPHLQSLVPQTTPTYAHRREAMIIRGEAKPIYAPPETLGAFGRLINRSISQSALPVGRVDREVKEGDRVGEMFQVVELPGHAYGQCGLWLESARLLIGGDVVGLLPWGMTRPFSFATPDMRMADDSIQRVRDLKVEILGVGHGAPIIGRAYEKIEAFAAKL
jgi:glyoxylase-like metal-dependent hydrolase (beta-lactamase superfamily II)